ncbi:MAG: PEGA domain-containing protein, partial [Myxococcota bacterium]|nr:PEGA domain-containing protein [Myxococcota bacterium]
MPAARPLTSTRPRLHHAAALVGLLAASAPSVALAQGAPQPPTEAETGVLQISAPVTGAIVYIDNEEVGVAPVTQYVPAGSHMLRITADGYDPYVRKIQVKAGARARVTASLIKGGGTVEFQSNARGATVLIDETGTSPIPVR